MAQNTSHTQITDFHDRLMFGGTAFILSQLSAVLLLGAAVIYLSPYLGNVTYLLAIAMVFLADKITRPLARRYILSYARMRDKQISHSEKSLDDLRPLVWAQSAHPNISIYYDFPVTLQRARTFLFEENGAKSGSQRKDLLEIIDHILTQYPKLSRAALETLSGALRFALRHFDSKLPSSRLQTMRLVRDIIERTGWDKMPLMDGIMRNVPLILEKERQNKSKIGPDTGVIRTAEKAIRIHQERLKEFEERNLISQLTERIRSLLEEYNQIAAQYKNDLNQLETTKEDFLNLLRRISRLDSASTSVVPEALAQEWIAATIQIPQKMDEISNSVRALETKRAELSFGPFESVAGDLSNITAVRQDLERCVGGLESFSQDWKRLPGEIKTLIADIEKITRDIQSYFPPTGARMAASQAESLKQFNELKRYATFVGFYDKSNDHKKRMTQALQKKIDEAVTVLSDKPQVKKIGEEMMRFAGQVRWGRIPAIVSAVQYRTPKGAKQDDYLLSVHVPDSNTYFFSKELIEGFPHEIAVEYVFRQLGGDRWSEAEIQTLFRENYVQGQSRLDQEIQKFIKQRAVPYGLEDVFKEIIVYHHHMRDKVEAIQAKTGLKNDEAVLQSPQWQQYRRSDEYRDRVARMVNAAILTDIQSKFLKDTLSVPVRNVREGKGESATERMTYTDLDHLMLAANKVNAIFEEQGFYRSKLRDSLQELRITVEAGDIAHFAKAFESYFTLYQVFFRGMNAGAEAERPDPWFLEEEAEFQAEQQSFIDGIREFTVQVRGDFDGSISKIRGLPAGESPGKTNLLKEAEGSIKALDELLTPLPEDTGLSGMDELREGVAKAISEMKGIYVSVGGVISGARMADLSDLQRIWLGLLEKHLDEVEERLARVERIAPEVIANNVRGELLRFAEALVRHDDAYFIQSNYVPINRPRFPARPSELQKIGEGLRRLWSEKGLEERFGEINQFLAALNGGYLSVPKHRRAERRLSYLLRGDMKARLWGAAVRAEGYAGHLNYFGPHMEIVGRKNAALRDDEKFKEVLQGSVRAELYDNDQLVRAVRRTLGLLAAWRYAPEDGELRNYFLWVLRMAMNPILHDPNYATDPNYSHQTKRYHEYRWKGDSRKPIAYFTRQMLSEVPRFDEEGKPLTGEFLTPDEIENVLAEALRLDYQAHQFQDPRYPAFQHASDFIERMVALGHGNAKDPSLRIAHFGESDFNPESPADAVRSNPHVPTLEKVLLEWNEVKELIPGLARRVDSRVVADGARMAESEAEDGGLSEEEPISMDQIRRISMRRGFTRRVAEVIASEAMRSRKRILLNPSFSGTQKKIAKIVKSIYPLNVKNLILRNPFGLFINFVALSFFAYFYHVEKLQDPGFAPAGRFLLRLFMLGLVNWGPSVFLSRRVLGSTNIFLYTLIKDVEFSPHRLSREIVFDIRHTVAHEIAHQFLRADLVEVFSSLRKREEEQRRGLTYLLTSEIGSLVEPLMSKPFSVKDLTALDQEIVKIARAKAKSSFAFNPIEPAWTYERGPLLADALLYVTRKTDGTWDFDKSYRILFEINAKKTLYQALQTLSAARLAANSYLVRVLAEYLGAGVVFALIYWVVNHFRNKPRPLESPPTEPAAARPEIRQDKTAIPDSRDQRVRSLIDGFIQEMSAKSRALVLMVKKAKSSEAIQKLKTEFMDEVERRILKLIAANESLALTDQETHELRGFGDMLAVDLENEIRPLADILVLQETQDAKAKTAHEKEIREAKTDLQEQHERLVTILSESPEAEVRAAALRYGRNIQDSPLSDEEKEAREAELNGDLAIWRQRRWRRINEARHEPVSSSSFSQWARVELERAKSLMKRGEYEQALIIYDALITDKRVRQPFLSQAFLGAAKAWSSLPAGDFPDKYGVAIEYLDEALRLDPENLFLKGERAWQYFYSGQYKEAILQADEILTGDPLNTSALNVRIASMIQSANDVLGIQRARTAIEYGRTLIVRFEDLIVGSRFERQLEDFERRLYEKETSLKRGARLAAAPPPAARLSSTVISRPQVEKSLENEKSLLLSVTGARLAAKSELNLLESWLSAWAQIHGFTFTNLQLEDGPKLIISEDGIKIADMGHTVWPNPQNLNDGTVLEITEPFIQEAHRRRHLSLLMALYIFHKESQVKKIEIDIAMPSSFFLAQGLVKYGLITNIRRSADFRITATIDRQRIGELVENKNSSLERLMQSPAPKEDDLDYGMFFRSSRNEKSEIVNRWIDSFGSAARLAEKYILESVSWNKDKVIAAIKRLHEAGLPLNAGEISKSKGGKVSTVLEQVLGQKVNGQSLYAASKRYFDDWDAALETSGINPQEIRVQFNWTPLKITTAIYYLNEYGFSLTGTKIQKDKTLQDKQVLKDVLGYSVSGRSLYAAARRHFGSWEKALEKAGLDVEKTSPRMQWSKLKITTAIHYLREAGVPLNVLEIKEDKSERTKSILKNAIGKSVTGQALYRSAKSKSYFGSWKAALKAAGVDPDKVYKYTTVEWTRLKITTAIHYLHSQGVAVNGGAIQNDNSEATQKLLEFVLGTRVTGSALYRAGMSEFKAWREALKASGVLEERKTEFSEKPGDSEIVDAKPSKELSAARPIQPPKLKTRMTGWSKIKITTAIHHLHEHNIPLYTTAISTDASERTSDILEDVLGWRVTGRQLYSTANRHFDSWSNALKASGLDPEKIMKGNQKFWTPLKITTAILYLYDQGIPLSSAAIQKDASDKIFKATEFVIGRRVGGSGIFKAATAEFGTWDKALLASGINLEDVHLRLEDWTKLKISTLVYYLHEAGIPAHAAAIQLQNQEIIKEIAREVVGHAASGRAIHQAALKLFDSWDDVLIAAGLDPRQIRQVVDWTKIKINTAIIHLKDNDIPLNIGSIKGGQSEKAADMLEFVLGQRTAMDNLYHAAVRHYGSWDQALSANGIDPETVRPKRGFWTPLMITSAIHHLYEAGIPLNSSAIGVDDSEESKRVLEHVTGRPITGRAVYSSASKHFDSWDAALSASGLDPTEIRKTVDWTKLKLTTAIHYLHERGIPLNVGSISQDRSEKTTQILKEVIGRATTGQALYSTAIYHQKFGSWDNALRTSGLNPVDVRKHYWKQTRFVSVPHQEEVVSKGEDMILQRLIGKQPITPDREAEINELYTLLAQVIENLPKEHRDLAELLIGEVMGSPEALTIADLADLLSTRMHSEIGEEKINEVMDLLKGDPRIQGILQPGSGARLADLDEPAHFQNKLIPEDRIITLAANVFDAQHRIGKMAVGSEEIEIALRADGTLMVYRSGKETLLIENYKSLILREHGTKAEVTLSMSDLQFALGQARSSLIDILPDTLFKEKTNSLLEMDLTSLDTGDRTFKELIIPLLVREIKSFKKENVRFLFHGPQLLKDALRKEIDHFDPSILDLIYFEETKIDEDYQKAQRVLIGAQDSKISSQGKRRLLIQSLTSGDLPNFKGLLKLALFEARIPQESFSDPASSFIQIFARGYETLLGKRITDVPLFITVAEGKENNPDKVRLFAIPPILRLPLNALIQGARLAIKTAEQAA